MFLELKMKNQMH